MRSQRGGWGAPITPLISKEGDECEMDPPDQSDESTLGKDLLKFASAHVLLLFNHPVDDRSEDQFHGKAHFSAVHNNACWAGHE